MSFFKDLFTNVRFYILIFSALLSGAIYFWAKISFDTDYSQAVNLTQTYALVAVTYLYFALLASPLVRFFPSFPFRAKYIQARRALGVSAFFFGCLHAYYAFFKELGGFESLGFLNLKYLTAITLSTLALTILSLMALTSFDFIIDKLGFRNWKFLHRFVYVAGLLITVHALMLGSAFTDLSSAIPQVFGVALSLLLILEAVRLDRYFSSKFLNYPKAGLSLVIIISVLVSFYAINLLPQEITSQLSVHQAHLKAVQDLTKTTDVPEFLKNMPGMQGDKTKRYTLDLDYPEKIEANKSVNFKFKVYDASTGNQISFFNKTYDKLIHMIIVDSSLTYYRHIHPELVGSEFQIQEAFPKDDRYHIYLDFQPSGAIEQQFAFNVKVGQTDSPIASQRVDETLEKDFGNYKVALSFQKPLKASRMSLGDQVINFKIMDKNGNPVTTLKPYLATFGHLVMIKQDSYDYLHIHPMIYKSVGPNENGGPEVVFMPAGIYGPIKPGIYRLFAQFNPDNNLITADFTVKVE